MKHVLLAIALFCSMITANAQDVKFGLKAGLNLANIAGDDLQNALLITGGALGGSFEITKKVKPGILVGGYVSIGINDRFSLQPELLYSAQGARFEVKDNTSGITVDTDRTDLNFLN